MDMLSAVCMLDKVCVNVYMCMCTEGARWLFVALLVPSSLSNCEHCDLYVVIIFVCVDLFDVEGYSLSDINTAVIGTCAWSGPSLDSVYKSDDEAEDENGCCGCLFHSPNDHINFATLKVNSYHKSTSLVNMFVCLYLVWIQCL